MANWTEEDLRLHELRMNAASPEEYNKLLDETVEAKRESLIEAECTKFLEEDGWRPLRTDPVSDRTRGKGFGELGMADHLYMRPSGLKGIPTYSDVLWVEFKARDGRVGSHQTNWHTKERARGFVTWIASVDFPASVEGFRQHYLESGLMRRARWW